MRLAILAAALLQVAGGPDPAAAQSAAAAPLRANEMLFEVSVVGRARSPADHIVVSVSYRATGGTAEEARRAAEAVESSLLAVARELGAERHEGNTFGVAPVGGSVSVNQMTSAGGREAVSAPSFRASGALPLRLDRVGRFQELRRALEGAGGTNVTGPIHMLRDDRDARRSARTDALVRAREEADQFASAQGMRVVRLLRFSEAPENPAMMTARLVSRATTGEVETSLSAQVGFALAPR